ncbi:MAG: hypothetical protein ONB23_09910 [candidate division KSB1 bacterium]|nr:hypothetical protein [candidate division KSB1 bacterium]
MPSQAGTFGFYLEGWRRVWRERKLLWLFYLPSLLLAYLAALPLEKALERSIGHSLMSDRVAERLTFRFLGDLAYEHPGLFPILIALAAAGAAVYVLLVTFLLAGAVRSLVLPAGRPLSLTLADSVSFFGCYLRLFLLSLPIYGLGAGVAFLVARGVVALVDLVGAPWSWVLGRALAIALFLAALYWTNLVFDLAKIFAAQDNERRALSSLRKAGRFLFARPRLGQAAGVYLLALGTGVFVTALYNLGAAIWDRPATAAILALVVWQQLFVLARVAVKLLFYGALGCVVSGERPQWEPVEPSDLLA